METSGVNIAALFDFDGVVMDTETQYTKFWNEIGARYLPQIPNFGLRIKGQTLTQIFQHYFGELKNEQPLIEERLKHLESEMVYEYIPGVVDFMCDLRRNKVKIAIVTSSNEQKMANVYKAHPELTELVDRILTSEMFPRSKPAPDCFLLGMKIFGTDPQHTYVFEDSFHGLEAGNASGAKVIGLATTNSREAIRDKARLVIDDFTQMSFQRMLQV